MDQELGKVDQETSGKSSNSVIGFMFDTVMAPNSEQKACLSAGNGDLEVKVNGLGARKVLAEPPETVMDQERSDLGGIGKASGQVGEGTSENSSNSVNGFLFQTVIVINPEEPACLSGGHGVSEAKIIELGSSKVLVEPPERVTNQETGDRRGMGEKLSQVDQGTSNNSGNSVDEVVFETVIVVSSEDNVRVGGGSRNLEVEGNELGSMKVQVKESKTKVSEAGKHSCMIDVKCGGSGGVGENWDGERVCRICHLSSESERSCDTTANTTMDLIQLGCGCKDELGIAHGHCAEAWFRLKGNRLCEICGETAKNVMGVGDDRFMEEWNERRFIGSRGNSSNSGRGCLRGQPFCNFLIACLVIAFVLPWFFRANMF